MEDNPDVAAPTETGEMLPLPRFARLAQRDYKAIWRLCTRGTIPCSQTPTGRYAISAEYVKLARALLDPPDQPAEVAK